MDENVETQEVAQNETSVNFSSTDIMVDVRQKRGDKPLYIKELDFLTGGKVIKSTNIAKPVIGFIVGGAILWMVTQSIITNPAWSLAFTVSIALLWAVYSVNVLTPKYDDTLLNYLISYLVGFKTRYHFKKEDKGVYKNYSRLNEDGSISTVIGGHGRIGKTSFQSDILMEREALSDYRNQLDGVTEVQIDTYGSQKFQGQRERLEMVIKNSNDKDLVELAKRTSRFYRKTLKNEIVEKQYVVFTTHNEEEEERLKEYIERLQSSGMFTIDTDFDEAKAKEILSLFK